MNGNCNVCGKIYLTNSSDLQMIYSLKNNTILKDNVADWHLFKPLYKIFTEKITLKIKQQQFKNKINLKTELYQSFKDTVYF